MNKLAFHYCSVDTFFSIITNKTLRLSDVVKSNDNLEVMWTKKVLLDMIKKEDSLYEYFSDEIKAEISLCRFKEKMEEKANSFFERKEIKSKFFAICFSGPESEDKLSQWRGYGDDGRGIAIGFSEKILRNTQKTIVINKSDEPRIEYNEVEYRREKQEDILKEFWKEQIRIANCDIKDFVVDFETWLIESFYKLYWKAIFMKNPFFEEENERRIVLEIQNCQSAPQKCELLRNKIQIREAQVTIRNGNIIEYYDLDISKLSNDLIQKIILGPKCKIDQEDVKMLLKKCGYKDVVVEWSGGSYR